MLKRWLGYRIWDVPGVLSLIILGSAAGFALAERWSGPGPELPVALAAFGGGIAVGLGFPVRVGLLAAALTGPALSLALGIAAAIGEGGFPDGFWETAGALFIIALYLAAPLALGGLAGRGMRRLIAALAERAMLGGRPLRAKAPVP